MPTHSASLASLVHPHQMEVQEFDSYALVIDARSAEAYQHDHLPSAVHVPVAIAARPPAQAPSLTQRPSLGGEASRPSMPYALAAHARRLSSGDSVLIYCDRGGLDSLIWAEPLRAAGWRVDVLGGGWGTYRRWVNAGLELLPRVLTFRPLIAPPVSGVCRVLDTLASRGEQVLDLSALAGQRLVPGLTLAGDEPPSQAAFETALLDALRRMDAQRPVWIRDAMAGLGDLTLPSALRDALLRSDSLTFEIPLHMRAMAWSERLQALNTSLPVLLQAFSASVAPPSSPVIEQWRAMADAGEVADALAAIIDAYIDPRSDGVSPSTKVTVIRLGSLNADAVAAAVSEWLAPDAAGDRNRPS